MRVRLTIIIICILTSNLALGQLKKDWTTITIRKGCTINEKFCMSELKIDDEGQSLYKPPCGQKSKTVTIDKDLIKNLKEIKVGQAKIWGDSLSLDSTCGYILTINDSDVDYVSLDIDAKWYDKTEIKIVIQTLNQIFKKFE